MCPCLPADGDQEPLGVGVRDEGGLARDVVVGEAVGELVDGIVVPELGVVVRGGRLVELRRVGLLRRRQGGHVAVEGGAHVGVGGQRGGAAEDVGGGGVHADRLGVGREVVGVGATR